MFFKRTSLATLALAGAAAAQRPANESICDYYTTALLKVNNATTQYTLLTLLVNTAVIGNYTQPNVGVAVNGILNKGMYNGTMVDLLPYFDGGLASTNQGGSSGSVVNFLDDGGAVPLMMNMPANGTSSAQYALLTHLYQYFGVLLGCSAQGFPAYAGDASQYSVHKYMNLNPYQVGYFIEQVGLSAASFGVASADVAAVGAALQKFFDYRCSPPTTIVPAQGAQLQSICVNEMCPLDPNATCSAYPTANGAGMVPLVANASLADGLGRNATSTMGSTATATSASATTATSPSHFTGAAQAVTAGWAMLVGGLAAAVL